MQYPKPTSTSVNLGIPCTAACAVVLGLAARIYLFYQIPLINPDGFLYIQQAKALYFGLFGQVLNCYHYLSPYPVAIAIAYRFFGDWVVAAQSVNIFFGTLTIIPLYWLLRRFFRETTASVTVLVFALLPAYVLVSRDVLRGPIYWFFAVTGLNLFILHIEKRRPLLLLFSSICLAVGAWSRIEGSLFIIVSVVFLPFSGSRRKWFDLFIFLAPYVFIFIVGLFFAHYQDINLFEFLKPERVFSRPMAFISKYNTLRMELKSLYHQDTVGFGHLFFPRVRNLIWLIALGTLIVQLAETLFYIFFIFLIIGMFSWAGKIRNDKRLVYLSLLSVLSLVLLYSQIIYNWAIASRFLAVFLLPSFVFMGAGIEKFISFLSKRFQYESKVGYAIVCILILFIFIPKTLRANFAEDKLKFHEIGRYIAERENGRGVVSVSGAFKGVRVIHFYANLNYPAAPCFDDAAFIHRTDSKGLQFIREKCFDYFVWDKVGWNDRKIGEMIKDPKHRFKKIREWDSQRRGKLILYEVTK